MQRNSASESGAAEWLVGRRLERYEPEVAARLEEAFRNYQQGSEEPHVRFALHGNEYSVDLRVMEEVLELASGGKRMRPVFRRERSFDSEEHMPALRTEWGHGQDVSKGVGVASYDDATSALLEEAFCISRVGSGLKGILFTGGNGVDYLADFQSMQQSSLITRRRRTMYRHAVGQGWRGAVLEEAVDPFILSQGSSESKQVCSISTVQHAPLPKVQQALPIGCCGSQLVSRNQSACIDVMLLLKLLSAACRGTASLVRDECIR